MSKSIIAITWGGIGDLVISTPALRAVKESNPSRRLIVYAWRPEHVQVLLHNPFIDSLRYLAPRRMWRYPYHLYCYLFDRSRIKYYIMDFQPLPQSYFYNCHSKELLEHVFSDLNISVKGRNVELYFTKKEERAAKMLLSGYTNVVLLHITSHCSRNHMWLLDRWEKLVRSLPEYTFVQMGYPSEDYVKGAIDLRGKTSLRVALCLAKFADGFVGVDSVFAHSTNAFGLRGVVLFGDSSPVYWAHENNINIFKGIRCSPCYETMGTNLCPYGHECMELITVEEVREALKKQMNSPRWPVENCEAVNFLKELA
jgi:ADP-heptose:LPS heptosyltransferase